MFGGLTQSTEHSSVELDSSLETAGLLFDNVAARLNLLMCVSFCNYPFQRFLEYA